MLAVVRGLLEVTPTELVHQRTRGGMPAGWSVLSLACNARDPHGERTEIVRLLAEGQANLEVRNAFGATPLITACQVGMFGCSAGHPGRGRQPPRHQQPWPQRLGRHAR